MFETFRDTCLKNYNLDPCQFYTAPGLSWSAALKMTDVKLELLTDPDMLLMFEKGIRGGICQAIHRYAKANNPYMEDQFDPTKETSYIQYLDANNLYGWAMSQPLPIDDFQWVKDANSITSDMINQLSKDEKNGYLLEVDVGYPKEIHDAHNELPFLPERMYCKKVEKLVPNLI